jgi:hypothetical protein
MSCEIQFLSLSTLERPGWQNDSPWKERLAEPLVALRKRALKAIRPPNSP